MNEKDKVDTAEEPIINQTPQPIEQTTQQPPQQIQYVNIINQKSLDGIGGWLLLWLILFAICGIGYITMFFLAISGTEPAMHQLYTIILSPLIGIGSILSAVLIGMRKKYAKLVCVATLAINLIYFIINIIADPKGESFAITAGTVSSFLVIYGLFILYFMVSKRVKQTLIK